MISKEQIVNGLTDFLTYDIMNEVKDQSLKTLMLALVKFIKMSPEIVDRVLENSMVSAILEECEGEYDVDKALKVIMEVAEEQGRIYLNVPSIPLIHPKETRIGLTVNDVEKLHNRLR